MGGNIDISGLEFRQGCVWVSFPHVLHESLIHPKNDQYPNFSGFVRLTCKSPAQSGHPHSLALFCTTMYTLVQSWWFHHINFAVVTTYSPFHHSICTSYSPFYPTFLPRWFPRWSGMHLWLLRWRSWATMVLVTVRDSDPLVEMKCFEIDPRTLHQQRGSLVKKVMDSV